MGGSRHKKKRLGSIYRILSASIGNFINDDCLMLASSVSFFFLLSIIPFSILAFTIIKTVSEVFFTQNEIAWQYMDMITAEIMRLIPFVTEDWIMTHLFKQNADISLTIFNFAFLPISCGLIFKTLEKAYRKIYGLPPRSVFVGQAIYAAMSISTVLFLFVFNFIWTIFTTTIIRIFSFVDKTIPLISKGVEILINFQSLYTNLTSAVILVLFFIVTVRFFLPTGTCIAHEIIGGVLFYFLWNMARIMFSIYINQISKFNVVYGSLSSVIVLLLWIYYSSAVLLFCVEFMHVLDEMKKTATPI